MGVTNFGPKALYASWHRQESEYSARDLTVITGKLRALRWGFPDHPDRGECRLPVGPLEGSAIAPTDAETHWGREGQLSDSAPLSVQ